MAVKQVFNTSAELDFPNVLPTLDLDFANSKTLDPRIDFTRASGGSYVGADGLIKYAGVNEARFDHDPETGESLGLLIEESRSNLIAYSEDFNDESWSKVRTIVTANAIAAPSGATTEDKLVEDTSNGVHFISQRASFTSGLSYTGSIFAKKGEHQWMRLGFPTAAYPELGRSASFNLDAGTLGIVQSGVTAQIVNYGNGWYRCSITATANATVTNAANGLAINPHPSNSATSLSYTGDGTSGIYVWGAQLETGAFPTSYIPTQASTRTRAADSTSITGKNFSDFYTPNEFTMRCIFSRFSNNTPPYPLAISSSLIANTALPSIRIRTDNNRSVQGQAVSKENTVVYNNNVNTFLNINQPCNAAIAVKSGDTIYSDSGKLAPVSNLKGSFDTATTLHISSGGARINGHMRKVTYFPKRLPNSQLISLTT
jgi:hypothetical protein